VRHTLLPEHITDLARSGITPETAAVNGIFTVTDPHMLGTFLGWKGPAKDGVPAMVIPYFTPDRKPTGYGRVKPTNPRTTKDGRKVKYEVPLGLSPRLYVPAGVTPEVLADPNVPIIFVEGEKKAIALVHAGFDAVAISGVWSWCRKSEGDGRQKELIPDFDLIALEGRQVNIIFDSDAATNDKVLWAEWYFAKTLKAKGADVRAVRLPDGVDEDDPVVERPKVGADDYLVAHGADALKVLIEAATTPARPKDDDHFDRTDIGNAQRLAKFAADRIRYVADRQVWRVYDGKRWVPDPKLVYVIGRAKTMLRKWKSEAFDKLTKAIKAVAEGKAEKVVEAEAREEFKFAIRTQDARNIRRMIDLARSENALLVHRFADVFDKDHWLLNAANGTIDLRTGTVRPHSPDDFLTKITPVPFDPEAEAPIYHRAVGAIFADHPDVAAYRSFVFIPAALAFCWSKSDSSLISSMITLHVFFPDFANETARYDPRRPIQSR
jgi:hypothetical protein